MIEPPGYFEEYAKHAALNIGQVAQGLRYFYSHPDIDRRVPRGTLKHFGLSIGLRARRVVNDFVFTLLPPRWHHTPEELAVMRPVPLRKWFLYGYCQWRFTETGAPKVLDGTEDRRWDSRCL